MGALFGTDAPAFSDLVALVEVAIAVVLVVGMLLVRRGHIRLHKYLQSCVILVNLPIVLLWMVPQYVSFVWPDLAEEFTDPFYLIPTLALFAGVAAQALGVYIILVAGTNWIPERFRFRRYKLWMRTELLLWWSIVALGLATYYTWYASGTIASSVLGG